MPRRRPRSENLHLYNTPALRIIQKDRQATDKKQANMAKQQEEGFVPRRRASSQHPTSAQFEQEGRVDPK